MNEYPKAVKARLSALISEKNERGALTNMVDRSHVNDDVIIIADRNYESYNVFAHIEQKGWNYLIRVKDLGSSGILSGLPYRKTGNLIFVFNVSSQESRRRKS